jgi:hypothetical protein
MNKNPFFPTSKAMMVKSLYMHHMIHIYIYIYIYIKKHVQHCACLNVLVIALANLTIWISKTLQEIRNVVSKHVIHGLYLLRFQFLKFVDVITTQHLFKMFNIWKVSGR